MYRYRCGVCRTISDHLYAWQAEDEQRRHIDSVHDGRTPEQQSITPVDGPPDPPLFRPPAPPGPPPGIPLHHEIILGITKSPRSLAVTIAALAFVGSLLVAWLVHTAPTFPVPPPYTPPAATHTPLPLPTGQPLASLLASANAAPPTPH
ncbi:hypothetical protein PUR71_14925 [Streptomyces sp. SP17BM10]|uniref:hypothetical protein n=1 Tax=Streptomyces sp. SP17BM10 TaxID=3002530 RepID=UPI002E7917B6|nr:hypothetical protein [Streptomyces sp. SP17BM10]MEE1784181.1 hypothetical protein [Streptomyces sp. SP17BM10]